MIRRMVNSLFLLFLLIDNTLRLKCYYASCLGSPSFSCDFYSNGIHLPGTSCANGTETQEPTSATNYTCVLKRKNRTEKITLLIEPKVEYKHKTCSGTAGLQLYQTPTFLWPLIVLPLCGVLETDRQMT